MDKDCRLFLSDAIANKIQKDATYVVGIEANEPDSFYLLEDDKGRKIVMQSTRPTILCDGARKHFKNLMPCLVNVEDYANGRDIGFKVSVFKSPSE